MVRVCNAHRRRHLEWEGLRVLPFERREPGGLLACFWSPCGQSTEVQVVGAAEVAGHLRDIVLAMDGATSKSSLRRKVRIRSVASPLGRRCIQACGDGFVQSRLTLRVSVCDGHTHIDASAYLVASAD